jgi:hypothetical protein
LNAASTLIIRENKCVAASLITITVSLVTVAKEDVKIARSLTRFAGAATAQVTRQQVAAYEALSTLQLPADASDLIGTPAQEADTYRKAKKYGPNTFFQYTNLFTRGRGKLLQHAKDLFNMSPLRHLLISLVVVLLCETMFTTKKWAHAVHVNHSLNLGGIEVIHQMEGNKK